MGLAGLVANYQAVGEDFRITSGEALPWDEIYRTIAAAAGTECRLSHLPTEVTWPQDVRALAAWRAGHPGSTRPDPDTNAVMDRLVRARHAAADAIVSGFSG